MNSNNIIQFKSIEKNEVVVPADYFGSEKIPVSDLLSMLDLLQKSKDEKKD